jgi:hypothetical protein
VPRAGRQGGHGHRTIARAGERALTEHCPIACSGVSSGQAVAARRERPAGRAAWVQRA